MQYQQLVKKTYSNKTKINDLQTLFMISRYLNSHSKLNMFSVRFGTEINFNLYELDLEKLKKIKIRPETIFKINCIAIKKALSTVFSDCTIDIFFEEPSSVGRNVIRIQNQTKHDVVIKIYNNKKNYEIGLEYNEKKSHNNSRQINNDNSRDIKSKMFLDLFTSYKESDRNFEFYAKVLTYDLLVILCSLKNDEYFLAKVIYYRSNKLNAQEEEFFNSILYWKKENYISIKLLHDIMKPVDEEGKEYEYDDYISHLEELQIKIHNDGCDYKNFIKLINNESNDCSLRIKTFRKIISEVADKLTDATKEIIKLIEKINDKKNLTQVYTDDIIKNLHTYGNKKIVELGIENYNKIHS